jgi:E3 ubiquitin-protein ligase BRE1
LSELESQVKTLLANQKEYAVKLDRLKVENESLSEQYNTEILKVIKAERKLDRARSSQVQKLEQQALANATSRPAGNGEENGTTPIESKGNNDALLLQYHEAMTVITKQKEQLATALTELKGSQEENTSLKARKEVMSDEDYARTEVFKMFKNQNEDLIRRINNFEATNKQLREEIDKLQAERSSFRDQLEREAQAVTMELEDQILAKEQDLTRIRSARDELHAENSQLKQAQTTERASLDHLKELTSATTDRVKELESELERLRPDQETVASREDIESLSLDELRQKYAKLERDFESINKEMPLLEKSYKKAMGLAHKKVMDFSALEDRVAQLSAEKSKADQKYFAARKDMDIRNGEIRSLRMSNGKSSDIISQLKEAEAHNRTLISNLEKQLVSLKQSNTTIAAENKKLEVASTDAGRRADAVKGQIAELTNLAKSKDAALASVREQATTLETELEKSKVRVDHISKDRDNWKAKSLSNSTTEEEMLRVKFLPLPRFLTNAEN